MKRESELIRIFEYALNQEVTGRSFFEHSLMRMGTVAARNAFKRLIEEEDRHIELLNRILKGLRDGPDLKVSGMEGRKLKQRDFFGERARSEFLQQAIHDSRMPDASIFNTAWLIEKDLAEFYGHMAEQTEGEAKKVFQMLSEWEKGHERFFKEFRDKLTDLYSRMYQGN